MTYLGACQSCRKNKPCLQAIAFAADSFQHALERIATYQLLSTLLRDRHFLSVQNGLQLYSASSIF